MCKTFGHHVVRVRTSWNPVSDRCGGQATVLLRSMIIVTKHMFRHLQHIITVFKHS